MLYRCVCIQCLLLCWRTVLIYLGSKHSTDVGMYFAEKLPGRWREVVSKQSDLVNAPRIGVEDNTMFANVQMNIASAKKKDGKALFFIANASYLLYYNHQLATS